MLASTLVQTLAKSPIERFTAEQYGVIRSAAYLQYLDLLTELSRGGGTGVGRVPTLAEWYGNAKGVDGVVLDECVGHGSCCGTVEVEAVSEGEFTSGSETVGGTSLRSGPAGVGASDAKPAGVDRGGFGVERSGCVDGERSNHVLGDNGLNCRVPCSGTSGGVDEGKKNGASADVRSASGSGRGVNFERNRANREKKKNQRAARLAAESRRQSETAATAAGGSVAGSVQTVDTRTGVEIEAAQTLAARRVAENKVKIAEAKVAAKLAEHRLKALNDKERSLVIDRLAAARLEEKINTAKLKSQTSFKSCDSPIESVGSALSAHEFAFKQQLRKIEALKVDVAYQRKQNEEFYRYATPDVRQRVAEIPEPHIPTDEEMEAEDADLSPEPTYEEMEAEAARYFSGVIV